MSIEFDRLKNNLDLFAKRLENTHKLASLLSKFCKDNIDNDMLYEVSYAAKLIEKELLNLGYELYLITNEQNHNLSLEDIIKQNGKELRH